MEHLICRRFPFSCLHVSLCDSSIDHCFVGSALSDQSKTVQPAAGLVQFTSVSTRQIVWPPGRSTSHETNEPKVGKSHFEAGCVMRVCGFEKLTTLSQ